MQPDHGSMWPYQEGRNFAEFTFSTTFANKGNANSNLITRRAASNSLSPSVR